MGVEKSHVGRASTIPADQNKYSKPEFNGIRLVANPHQGDADVGMFLPINFGPSFPELGPFSDVPHSAFFRRHALRRQPLKQGAGSQHIRGRETFGEPIINRCQRCSRLVLATLAHPQTGNAEGDPQLPR
jgi:hypothetical protein